MSELSVALVDYLALRRSLGYKLQRSGVVLADFVAYSDAVGARHVTVEVAVTWATQPVNADSGWRAQRLGMVRCFARYLQALDAAHQIPPPGVLPPRRRRPPPYLFSEADITALMAAARQDRCTLRSATLETVVGLLAVTGLRVAEVLRLDRSDLDIGRQLLLVRNSKAGKSRAVPLHQSTIDALRAYGDWRDQLFPEPVTDSLFVTSTGTRLASGNLRASFSQLLDRAGVASRTTEGGPRLGDLRHSFAVRTLLDWYQSGVDVPPRLPLLSAYLGHVSPASTYWYLQAAPELLAAAAQRLDRSTEVLP